MKYKNGRTIMKTRSIEEIEKEIEEVRNELLNVHGNETEVYARIVGYYRCVTNWNKGKRDEYNHRKLFQVESGITQKVAEEPFMEEKLMNLVVKNETPVNEILDEEIPSIPKETKIKINMEENIQTYELYTRLACPHCPPVKQYMEQLVLDGKHINVDEPQGLYTAAEKGVFSTPTVIFYDANGKEIARAHNTDEIKELIENNQAQAIA